MSAMIGTGERGTIWARPSAAASSLQVQRTMSAPPRPGHKSGPGCPRHRRSWSWSSTGRSPERRRRPPPTDGDLSGHPARGEELGGLFHTPSLPCPGFLRRRPTNRSNRGRRRRRPTQTRSDRSPGPGRGHQGGSVVTEIVHCVAGSMGRSCRRGVRSVWRFVDQPQRAVGRLDLVGCERTPNVITGCSEATETGPAAKAAG